MDYTGKLEEASREFSEKSINHIKIKYPNDDRYIVTGASTPSDVRAGDNLAQIIIKKFF